MHALITLIALITQYLHNPNKEISLCQEHWVELGRIGRHIMRQMWCGWFAKISTFGGFDKRRQHRPWPYVGPINGLISLVQLISWVQLLSTISKKPILNQHRPWGPWPYVRSVNFSLCSSSNIVCSVLAVHCTRLQKAKFLLQYLDIFNNNFKIVIPHPHLIIIL